MDTARTLNFRGKVRAEVLAFPALAPAGKGPYLQFSLQGTCRESEPIGPTAVSRAFSLQKGARTLYEKIKLRAEVLVVTGPRCKRGQCDEGDAEEVQQ